MKSSKLIVLIIVLKYTDTQERCPNCDSGMVFLYDNQEEKICCECRTKWNRIDGTILK